MMSPINTIPFILLISSIHASTSLHIDTISKIDNELNPQMKYNIDDKSTSPNKDENNNAQIGKAIIKGNDIFDDNSKLDVNTSKKMKPISKIHYDLQMKSYICDKSTAPNKNENNNAQIEKAIENDVKKLDDDSKLDVNTAKTKRANWNDNHKTDFEKLKIFEIYKLITKKRRVKRDDDFIWDGCPDKLSYKLIDGVLKCVADAQEGTGLSDRVFEPLENDTCSEGRRRIQVGGAVFCIESRRRKKNR